MSEAKQKHAPGPWSVGYQALDVRAPDILGRNDTFKICDIRGWGYLTGGGAGAIGLPTENAKAIQIANSNLIAAAPDMLAALRPFEGLLDSYEGACGEAGFILPWVEFIADYKWPSEQECINARIAVAKAPGGQS